MVSSMTLFQLYSLYSMFSKMSDFEFSARLGPLELSGWWAYVAFVIPGALFVFSIWAIGKGNVFKALKDDFSLKEEGHRDPFDYTHYSERELIDVSKNIDKEAHPERYKKLMAEIETRRQKPTGGSTQH